MTRLGQAEHIRRICSLSIGHRFNPLTRRIIGLVFCLLLWGAVAELYAQRATVLLRLQGEAISVQGQLVWRIDPAAISASDIQIVESQLRCGRNGTMPEYW